MRQAQASGLPPDVAVTLDHFSQALRTLWPLGGWLELALHPTESSAG